MQRKNNQQTLNPTRRNTVRLALATGATVTTLLGAQALAFLEPATAADVAEPTEVVASPSLTETATNTATNTATQLPTATARVIIPATIASANKSGSVLPSVTSTAIPATATTSASPTKTATKAPTLKPTQAKVQPTPRTRTSRKR